MTFGIKWDEYHVQSERVKTGIYKDAAEKLVLDGHAFYCQCEAKNADEEGYSKQLRDPCREKNLKSGAVKLKVPEKEKVTFFDFILKKEVSWDSSTISDATMLKSDGYPTYHLAVVVDDTDMKITHVLRGHDWMPSTPIHLLIYKYLRYDVPKIGHLTDILDPEGGKLSKRKGSTSCRGLLSEGYLPDAILNFIMLTGWAPKDNREIYSLGEFVKAFNPDGFQVANPIFNREKLDWFNGYYIRSMKNEDLIKIIDEHYQKKLDLKILERSVPVIKERITLLSDYMKIAGFFYKEPTVDKNLLGENYIDHLRSANAVLSAVSDWKLEKLNTSLMEEIREKGYKTGAFFMDLRIAITGEKFTPPINESITVLGKIETLNRIKKTLNL